MTLAADVALLETAMERMQRQLTALTEQPAMANGAGKDKGGASRRASMLRVREAVRDLHV